jgi:hypothetical protein
MKKTTKLIMVLGVFLLSATLVGATLLQYYGKVSTTANVKQSIVFDSKEDNSAIAHTISEIYGGCSACYKEIIKNRGCIDGNVEFKTEFSSNSDGVTATIYKVPDLITLKLNNKADPSWAEIDGDGIEGTLTFDPDSPTFDYTLDAKGLLANTSYSLIYYGDPWAGNHPGAYIATVTTDASGNIVAKTGSQNINTNIPSSPDQNYVAKTGGKIWLVLSADYDGSKMIAWNMPSYLFENKLVVYTDCDLTIDSWMAPLLGSPVTTLTVPANGHVDLLFCYQFAINIAPDTYTMSTKAVVPT